MSAPRKHNDHGRRPMNPKFPAWFDLAMDALALSVRDDMPTATERLIDLLDIYGNAVLYEVMSTWADTTSQAQGIKPGTMSRPSFMDSDSKAISLQDVAPAERWAAWFLAACASRDIDTLRALISGLEGPQHVAANATALLRICGLTLRMLAGAL